LKYSPVVSVKDSLAGESFTCSTWVSELATQFVVQLLFPVPIPPSAKTDSEKSTLRLTILSIFFILLSPSFDCFSVEEAIKSTTNKKRGFQNMFSRMSDEINEVIQNAKQHESIGRYDDAAKILSKYWKNTNERPDTSELNKAEQAEVLLRCGSLAGYIGSCKQKKDAQEFAQTLITEASRLFWLSGDIEKIAECETSMAITYQRIGQLSEARS
jgi:hypothetical protein